MIMVIIKNPLSHFVTATAINRIMEFFLTLDFGINLIIIVTDSYKSFLHEVD